MASQRFIQLPEELQIDVFFRLAVRSLLICKCVCKLFRTIIQNPDFEQARRSLNISIATAEPDRTETEKPLCSALSGTACTSELLLVQSDNNINIVSIDTATNDVISSTLLTTIIPYIRSLFLVGSCNGLVCFSARTKRKWDNMLLLWNPVSRKTKYLPEPPKDEFYYKFSTEFCFIPETNDYIVLIIGSPYRGTVRVAVYKMSTDSWTIHRSNISIRSDLNHQMTPVFVNGSFHWGVKSPDSKIISYNPKEELFREIKTPFNHDERFVDDSEWNVAVIEGSLGVMYWNYRGKGEVHIFKMKDYRVQDSWLYIQFRNSLLSPLLGNWKDKLITTDSRNFYLYDYDTHKRKQWIPQSAGLPRLCSFLDTNIP
ncbi:F-box/kelch-repeat protein At3g06240-like [Apium graveolens]|uniref:F-box/kelch-repeat protein At3g06240-like n=1 Tax=Apium graveolens TaxID=4045 RepID=UPI003D7A8250